MAKNDLVEWLQSEIDRRGWTATFLGERAGISSAHISHLFRGERKPGIDAITGMARALGVPVETVMRHAGWLPMSGEILPEVRNWNEELMSLSEDDRAAVIGDMDALLKTLLKWLRPGPGGRGRRAG